MELELECDFMIYWSEGMEVVLVALFEGQVISL